MALAKSKTAPKRKIGMKAKPRAETPRRAQAGQSAETKSCLLAAAAGLIRSRGYAQLRTAEVAAAAGVSRSAMLHHFANKNRARRRHARTRV